jgi:hypothetical protein
MLSEIARRPKRYKQSERRKEQMKVPGIAMSAHAPSAIDSCDGISVQWKELFNNGI